MLPDVGGEQKLFPISTVTEATGVPTVTLRAWERRYDFLRPQRTAKGHRLYSMEQIEMIRRVTALIDSGMPVSRVGDLIRTETRPSSGAEVQAADSWQAVQDEMMEAVCAFDEARLDEIYENLLARFSDARITEAVVIPLLRRLGANWAGNITGVAEEHFFSLYLRNKLGARWHHGRRPLAGRRLVVACMPGERHEYGLLFFALVARARGFDPILLGADMPLVEIAKVVSKTRAAGIVISSTITPGWQLIERDVKALVSQVDVPVFLGGAGVMGMNAAIAGVGAILVGAELVTGVENIYRHISGGK